LRWFPGRTICPFLGHGVVLSWGTGWDCFQKEVEKAAIEQRVEMLAASQVTLSSYSAGTSRTFAAK